MIEVLVGGFGKTAHRITLRRRYRTTLDDATALGVRITEARKHPEMMMFVDTMECHHLIEPKRISTVRVYGGDKPSLPEWGGEWPQATAS